MKKILNALLSATALFVTAYTAHAVHAAEVTTMGAKVHAPVPGGPSVAAMFLTINNSSSEEYRIVRAHSELAQSTELHGHVEENGVAKMRPVSEIVVPPHGHVDLQPGGLHLMLIGLKKPLKMGDRVKVRLYLDHGGSVVAIGTVTPRS